MEVVYPVCCGLDVHKAEVTACLVWRDAQSVRQSQVRTFGTTTGQILELADWLKAQSCPIIAMESTGVYWKPLYNLLEGEFEVMLVNPTHLKHVKGHKTDVQDAAWLAQLLEHGLLRASFIPPREIREVRDLTRYRRRQIQIRSGETNRLQKIMEDANLKLASVVSDVRGVSARAMLEALLGGVADPAVLAGLAQGRLRAKQAELTAALECRLRPHHALLLGEILAHIDYLDGSIAHLDQAIEEALRPFQEDLERLDTIPGVNQRSAQEILAEVGPDMSVFPSHAHLGSWAGVCPGNNQSAGKRKSGRTPSGNKWLRTCLLQSAHAAGRTRDTYLGVRFRRLAKGKKTQRAAVAIAHDILDATYFILRDGVEYEELGADFYDKLNGAQIVKSCTKRLNRQGYAVTLTPLAQAA
jgi:transposase